MGAQLLGVQGSGKSGELAIAWAMGAGSAQSAPDALQLPTFPFFANTFLANVPWQKYVLNPMGVQGLTNFGIGRVLAVTLNTMQAWYVDATHHYIPGRVAVRIPSTNQLILLTGNNTFANTMAAAAVFFTKNTMFPIWLANYASVEVWVEPDVTNGVSAPAGSVTSLQVVLFNTDIHAPGNIN